MNHRVYIALLHAPVYNKRMEVISTSITNLDLHDISRTARTYGIRRYYLVHPIETQQNLAREMISYWREGYGAEYNPDRREAMNLLELASDLDTVLADIQRLEGQKPLTVATDARQYPQTVGYLQLRRLIQQGDQPYLILFGTGWGLTAEMMKACDYILQPIEGCTDYNHLSVRSAAAIILDRLLGERWW